MKPFLQNTIPKFMLNGAASAFQFNPTSEQLSSPRTALFMTRTRQVVDSESLLLEIVAESINPASNLQTLVITRDDGAQYSATRSSPRNYPGTTIQNNASCFSVTVPLNLGENSFKVTTGDPALIAYDSSGISVGAVGELYDEVFIYRKNSLVNTTVTSLSALASALAGSATANIGLDSTTSDIITVDFDMNLNWKEWQDALDAVDGISVNPFETRGWTVTLQPAVGRTPTFKMNYHEVVTALTDPDLSPYTNFGEEYLVFQHLHFKGFTFGQASQPMSGIFLPASPTRFKLDALGNKIEPSYQFESCIFMDKYTQTNDANLVFPPTPVIPAEEDYGRNRFSTTFKKMDYPDPDFRAPGPSTGDFTSTAGNTVGSVTSWNVEQTSGESLTNLVWLKGIECEDLGSNTYEIRLIFPYANDAKIFISMGKYFEQHNYSGDNASRHFLKLGTSNVSFDGWTGDMTGGTSFTGEIQGDPTFGLGDGDECTVSLRGPKANAIGALIYNQSSLYVSMAYRSASLPSYLIKNTADSDRPEYMQGGISRKVAFNFWFKECSTLGLASQGGIVPQGRFVDCSFNSIRGDLGHNALLCFNVIFAGGQEICIQDWYDATHSDLLQTFAAQAFQGRILQNVYFTAHETFPCETIPIQQSSTRISTIANNQLVEYYKNTVLDSWQQDNTVYTITNGIPDAKPVAANVILGINENTRFSNLNLPTADFSERWDLSQAESKNKLAFSGSYFYNLIGYTYDLSPVVGSVSSPDNEYFTYGGNASSSYVGGDLTGLLDSNIIGTTRTQGINRTSIVTHVNTNGIANPT